MIESEYTEPVSDLPRPILQINSYQEQTTLKLSALADKQLFRIILQWMEQNSSFI